MRLLSFIVLFFSFSVGIAQPVHYSTSNGHSHNDYNQSFPFWQAWKQGFGSIEADVYFEKGQIIVAHGKDELKLNRTLDSLYLVPLQNCIQSNSGSVYTDRSLHLQLMIDIKSDALSTLKALVALFNKYPLLINCPTLTISISGNRPAPPDFDKWPDWIHFDAVPGTDYPTEVMAKIVMFSDNFQHYTLWNGKGRLPESDKIKLQEIIDRAHKAGKKIRFWNAPDLLNSWYTFTSLGVDYINTDQVEALGTFFRQLPDRHYQEQQPYSIYQPIWKNDAVDKPVKNVILLIGDGTGLPQWYSGYTANRGRLNVFNMHSTGFSKTSSYDNYITDSAPGATAFSSGEKTNNRSVGVDHTGHKLQLLPAILRSKGMKTGIITSGDLRDATPAAFYAHRTERSDYAGIIRDFIKEPVDIIMGSYEPIQGDSIHQQLTNRVNLLYSLDSIVKTTQPLFVADKRAGLSVLQGRKAWASQAFNYTVSELSKHLNGFFLVLEGAQIDHGGHANKLPYVVTEVLDFDKVVGEAMKFADSNGETLVVVTADHETGGLTLTAGDYTTGSVSGQFSTTDHTALPVPVFAYGPRSYLFNGVYENTGIFSRILRAMGIDQSK